MCISAPVSFVMAGLLASGGGLCVARAVREGRRYLPLALFPVFIGIQQYMEGWVWLKAGSDPLSARTLALAYLFFTWVVWPVWIPYMISRLEPEPQKTILFRIFMLAGALFGMMLYLPNFWHPGWLGVSIVRHSVYYRCIFLPDAYFPRVITSFVYLALVGLPPLLSTHPSLRLFGAGLVLSTVLTYLFFSYAEISVLCFFAAALTLYIVYIILCDRAKSPRPSPAASA